MRTDQRAPLTDDAPPTPKPGTTTQRLRRVHDDTLNEWRVYERVCGTADLAAVRLVFESSMAIRMLTSFPADWDRMSDEDLLALSHRPARG